ncbi:tetratricopeptide repeat protein [Paenibacillus sp. NEAU-GSW1]|uniref:tetratricopeptide repeat protein n=1 Tax=Paenibacillus sp. NEAU-GSW1 TaxID=2682486 RepID=UPI0012E2366F|nr:tetratricopeptide repeat protein [Paenibacillus sp. NEAU-GSW1]MUT64886.1 tetratricopeptide repeat protein [Paenibacillus sp. NEAU-GSW1]
MVEDNKFYPGMLHLKREEYELARDFFQSLTDQEPNNAEAHAWLAAAYGRLLENGSLLEKVMLLPDFEKEVATALELDAELTLARKVNGLRLLHTPKEFGGDPEEAAKELEYAIANGEKDSEAYYGLGLAYLATELKEKAEAAFIEALQYNPNHAEARQQLEFIHKGATL